MFAASSPSRLPAWPLRLVAVACVGLVAILSWLAADPAAHAALHALGAGEACHHAHDGHDHENGFAHDEPAAPLADDAGCVITAFVAGATDLLALVFLVLLFALRVLMRVPWVDFVPAESRLAGHAPSCGPPVAA